MLSHASLFKAVALSHSGIPAALPQTNSCFHPNGGVVGDCGSANPSDINNHLHLRRKKKAAMSPPTVQPMEENDVLEFTSATEGEAESSLAWEVVPEKKVACKIGIKSDTELDHLLKKVVEEAKSLPVTSSSAAASTSSKDVISSVIKEDITAEKSAEQEAGDKAEEEAAAKKVTSDDDINWQEADFDLEDAPPPPSKESFTPALGRKNLTAAVPDDSDSEIHDVQHKDLQPSAGSKRKGRPTSQGGAKKRALPLKSPRSSSAGPKLKAAPVAKSSNKMPREPETSHHQSASPLGRPQSSS